MVNKPLPEITIKAIFLGIILSMILAGANAYLGLFAGMTVSASIPAAVISMGVLRLFKNHSILENNIVQTSASAGESLAAGVIFTIPALILMNVWPSFGFDQYWIITGIAATGGLVGVLFTIPLRRALILEEKLQFPEGVATAEVLRTGEGEAGKAGVLLMVYASLAGAVLKLGAEFFKLWSGVASTAVRVKSTFFSFQFNLSPALISVGYIVGLNISLLVFGGGVLGRWVFLPILAPGFLDQIPTDVMAGGAQDAVNWLHNNKIKYIGVGSMIVGGLWALINLRSSVTRGIKSGLEAVRKTRRGETSDIPREERDTPLTWVGIALLVSLIPILAIYMTVVHSIVLSAFMAVIMLLAGFLFSAVAAYMAGLVGSSNNPISGVTIATVLSTSLLLFVLYRAGVNVGPSAAIFIGAIVCSAAAIGGDNLQDLKTGHIVGATPWKQQVMQAVGVLSGSVVMMPVLYMLHQRYGIGTDAHLAVELQGHALEAPQASLMANIARGVFEQNLPWDLIGIGAAVAILIIALDKTLEARGSEFRTPILAVAVGIYLPFHLSVPIFVGGMIAYLTSGTISHDEKKMNQSGLLLASGLITGEALLGILLAVPMMLNEFYGWSIPTEMAVFDDPGPWIGVILVGLASYWLYAAAKTYQKKRE
ncbi:MAG: oligopeptide transporter, OPT family [Candidatus Marinimicrobia bacterium]|nr:oligopeptide transporter, OPT family [Candidatus Neomarinimicrobiota bacterium]